MDKISALDGVFKIFQVFGHQFFSVKSVQVNQKGKIWKKVLKTVHIVIILSIILFLHLMWLTVSFLARRSSPKQFKFNFFFNVIMSVLGFLTHNVNIVESWLKKCEYFEFFKITDDLSKLWIAEFGVCISYKRLKKMFELLSLSLLIFSFFMLIGHILLCDKTLIPGSGLEILSKTFLVTMINLIFMKFYFYWQIVHFHLKVLRDQMQRKAHPEKSHFISSRDVIIFRKVFCMIREMSNRINRAMELVFAQILLLSCVSIIRDGFKLFMLVGDKSNDNIWGESSLKTERLFIVN